MTISSPECGFPLVLFADSHSMVGTDEGELGKLFSSPQHIQLLPNWWQQVPVLDCEVIEASIVDAQPERAV